MSNRITRFTIVGGGSAGWLAASILLGTLNRRNDGADTQVELIESPTIPIVGVGEATTLSTFVTFAQLNIDELDFLKHCDATFKAAVRFSGWDVNADGSPRHYYHPFDAPPYMYNLPPAYHWHRRARADRAAGRPVAPFAHAMSPTPALMDAMRAPRSFEQGPFEGLVNYSYHLDATKLGEYLRGYCTALGVDYIADDVDGVQRDERGFISALQLRRRGGHAVEFVIDCSGFRSLILRQAMGEDFVPYSDSLLCDRALAAQLPHAAPDAPIAPFTTATALGAGWSWEVPLWSRRGTGYVYSSAHRSDDEAIAEFRTHLGEAGCEAEPRVIPMAIGRARRGWVKNCLGVGLSAGFIEPLESTSIHLTQVAIRRFLDHLPERDCAPVLAARYNRLTGEMYDDIRDFIVMHYCLSNRDDTPFWRDAKEAARVPDRVRERLALWRRKLPSALDIDTNNPLFPEWSYIYVLFGKGAVDDIAFPLEAAISDDDLDAFLAEQAAARARIMARAPDHRALLTRVHAEATDPWYGAAGAR
jgi:tryptophan halogenase